VRPTVVQEQEQTEDDGVLHFNCACAYAQEKKERAIRERRLTIDDEGKHAWRNFGLAEKANGWIDARAVELRAKFNKGPGEIMGNRPQEGLYGAYATICLVRGGGSLVKYFTHGLEAAGGAAATMALGAPFSLLSAGPLAKDALKVDSTSDKAKRTLVDKLDGAKAYMARIDRGETPKPAEARAYLDFMAAAKKIKALNRLVARERHRAYANAVRSGPLQVTNGALRIARDIGTTAHTVGGTVAGSLGATASILSVANGAMYCYIGSIEHGKAHQQKEKAKAMQEKLTAFNPDLHDGPKDAIPRIIGNLQTNFERLHRQGVRDRRYANIRITRGVADIAVGSALAGVGIAALIGVSVASAGVALGVISAVVAGGYLVAVAGKFHHKKKCEHTSKRRQRHAQMLIATIPGDALRQKFIAGERTSLTAILTAYQKNKRYLGSEVAKDREVDIGSNEYVALHFLAQDLLAELDACAHADGSEQSDADYSGTSDDAMYAGADGASNILGVLGMKKRELDAMAIGLQEFGSEESRLEYVKKIIAPVFGVPFRVDGAGKEAEGALKVFQEKPLTAQDEDAAEQQSLQTTEEESSSRVKSDDGSSSSSRVGSRSESRSKSDGFSPDGQTRKSEPGSGSESEAASDASDDAPESSEQSSEGPFVSMSQSAVPLSVSSSRTPGL
jgi:hypothetical protein